MSTGRKKNYIHDSKDTQRLNLSRFFERVKKERVKELLGVSRPFENDKVPLSDFVKSLRK